MMSKYDKLKEPSDENTFVGDKFADKYSDFIYTKEGTSIIQGFPACPECGSVLARRFLQDTWYCSSCNTVRGRHSLIEALQNERAIAKLYEEETDGNRS